MTGFLIPAFFLGLVYSAAPGAVNTEALRRGLKRGFMPSFKVQIGALLGDFYSLALLQEHLRGVLEYLYWLLGHAGLLERRF